MKNSKILKITSLSVIAVSGDVTVGCTGQSVVADSSDVPAWLEADSARAIHQRLLRDFPVTFEEGAVEIINKYPHLTIDSIRCKVGEKYVEVMVLDDEERMFRKALRNIGLLDPSLNGGWKHRGWNASPARISYVDSVIRHSEGKLERGGAHRIKIRYSVDVPYHECIAGDTLSVWMPYPIESPRQTDVNLISTSQKDYAIAPMDKSAHRTIFMKAPVAENDTVHFEYVVEYTARGQYFSPAYIESHIRPYEKESEAYKRYTSFPAPHYTPLDSLATAIVGDEQNPYRQSELVYDYIINHYPWAGAREYSTISCIPQYVVEQGHGDCGQVALLYISLMRSLGVPARWESGWMLHPGELNYHDWAEVYFEGVGWVPVDVSFGRYTSSDDPAVQKFYSTGMDSYRFATNTDVSRPFYPRKTFIRSETVDCQAGEVETSKGNLFYPAWDQKFEILSVEPVE